jgi:hypothetical protein
VIDDLEKWQRRLDPSWFLIMRIANPIIDQRLAARNLNKRKGLLPIWVKQSRR